MKIKYIIIDSQKKRKQMQRRREIKERLFNILIRYPFILPIQKIHEIFQLKRKTYWSKNLNKLKEKSVNEMMDYIIETIFTFNMKKYMVYNARCHDDIFFDNAFYLREFAGYGWHYRRKVRKWSMLYYELSRSENSNFDEERFYQELFETLKHRIQSRYEDVEISDGRDDLIRRYDCFWLWIKD